ncbi:MAG: methyltransferase domain-containing protein [Gammaproteobacteria bacterium]|nr:methyltransferase domain-containing protein [Gammaproteobacteria bacterium]
MNTGDIHLVLGISCSGKSSYIEHKINKGEWKDLPLLMAYEIEPGSTNEILNQECIVHYNLIRPFDNDADNINNEFLDDKILSELLSHKDRIKAHLLIVHPAILSKRVLLQTEAEGGLRKPGTPYPQQKIFELLCRLDIPDFYDKWINLLDKFHIDFEMILSETSEYTAIPSVAELPKYLNSEKTVSYTDAEISEIVKNNDFEYQQIQLPNNQFTQGDDRSPSLSLLDKDLSGKSLLDIGCAYGYFCFEAEKRNALRVVGTELKRHRYIGANLIKQMTGAKSQILYKNIFDSPLNEEPGNDESGNEEFDIVLLLNVIHHLKEPIKALRMIAGLCTEKLIIEFPTLSDSKFNSTLPAPTTFDAALPIIGVSLQTGQDQTFLFSPQAIERILLDHDKLFSKIDFMQSPMDKERCVAICYK